MHSRLRPRPWVAVATGARRARGLRQRRERVGCDSQHEPATQHGSSWPFRGGPTPRPTRLLGRRSQSLSVEDRSKAARTTNRLVIANRLAETETEAWTWSLKKARIASVSGYRAQAKQGRAGAGSSWSRGSSAHVEGASVPAVLVLCLPPHSALWQPTAFGHSCPDCRGRAAVSQRHINHMNSWLSGLDARGLHARHGQTCHMRHSA